MSIYEGRGGIWNVVTKILEVKQIFLKDSQFKLNSPLATFELSTCIIDSFKIILYHTAPSSACANDRMDINTHNYLYVFTTGSILIRITRNLMTGNLTRVYYKPGFGNRALFCEKMVSK